MAGNGVIKIRIAGVSLKLGDNQVLRDIDIDVPVGSKSVIIGPAASGKTVLMKCVAGILRPDSGTIEIDGVRVNGPNTSERKQTMQSVGVLFQQGGLFDSVTVWENISFKLTQTFGVRAAEAKRIAIEKLAMVDLPAGTADLNPSELSGGMQKRVGIARALAGDPSLLLLDEPTAGLDPITTAAINRQIDRSAREIGATVLAITSDMTSAHNDYDHLVMLNEGAVVWSGLTKDIESSGNPYVQQLIHGHAEGPIKMRLKARI